MISSSPPIQTTSTFNKTSESGPKNYEPDVYYKVCEVLVALFAIVGNTLVITVFCKERRLRRRTNYYIVSLAAADLLVGLLAIPFALLASVGKPTNLHACLFTVSLLVVLCTISIFCLVAVSVDRYWAILYPMGYSRYVRTKTALVIISICWVTGCLIGFLPLFGWHKDQPTETQCFFLEVMDYNYLVFLYIVTIITPALLLAAFYAHIYRVVLKQLRQIVVINPGNGTTTMRRTHGGTMLRMLGAAQKREVKATQNLSIIVLFFMICWIPLYTINFILAFCHDCFEVNSTLMLFCIILSHLNSAGNPLLYAYHLRDFRAAMKHFLCAIVGLDEPRPSTPRINGRISCGSTVFPNHYHNRIASLRESHTSLCQQVHSNKSSLKSYSLPNTPKIASIVTQTAALAAAPTGETAREIWRISEIPSVSDEHSHSKQDGNANNGYIEGPFDLEEGDDDVFLDGYIPFNELFSHDEIQNSSSDSANSHSVVDITTQSFTKLRTNCISSSSPQLNRGLFLVEGDITEETTFAKRSLSEAERNGDEQLLKTTKLFASPVKSLKLSPLRIVWLHRPKNRSKSVIKLGNVDTENNLNIS